MKYKIFKENVEDTKKVIWTRKSKMDRQYFFSFVSFKQGIPQDRYTEPKKINIPTFLYKYMHKNVNWFVLSLSGTQ